MTQFCALCVAVLVIPASVALAVGHTDGSASAPSNVTRLVTHVPEATLDKVGAGQVLGQGSFPVSKLKGAPLRSGGKPELLATIFAWCPHCAANSWGLAVALSRFGKLSDLRIIDTGILFGQFNHSHGLSFFGADHSSPYPSFVPVILQDVKGHTLETPTAKEQNAVNAFDPQGTPAIDVGGRWGFVNAGYSPAILAGKNWSQIAALKRFARPSTERAIALFACARLAAICDQFLPARIAGE